MKRLFSVLCMLLAALSVCHAFAAPDNGTGSGMIRVQLASLGMPAELTITVSGSYAMDGQQLASGSTVRLAADASGQIKITANGASRTAGNTVTISRRDTASDCVLRIGDRSYPGSLTVTCRYVQESNGYRLDPVLTLYIEDYLPGVLPAEIGDDAGAEALKAQAVAARTYALARAAARTGEAWDVTDTVSDQVYAGHVTGAANSASAVEATRGIVLLWNGSYAETLYTASNGGQTESPLNLWGTQGYTYLGVKDDPYDAANGAAPSLAVTVYASGDDSRQPAGLMTLLTEKARSRCTELGRSADGLRITKIEAVTPHTPRYAEPSRLYTRLDFRVTVSAGGSNFTTSLTCDIFGELESLLGLSVDPGQGELWSVTKNDTGFVITARRYGHGIGMSQRGAMRMAALGHSWPEILSYYYEGCTLSQVSLVASVPLSGSMTDNMDLYDSPAELPGQACLAVVKGVSGTRIGVLRDARSGAEVLAGLEAGSLVTVRAQSGSWMQVTIGSVTGFVPAECLRVISGTPGSSVIEASGFDSWATVTGDARLNMRAAPSLDAAIITTIYPGEAVGVLMNTGDWSLVQYGAQTGWCSNSWLRKSAAYPLTTTESVTQQALVTLPGNSGTVNLRASASTAAGVITQIGANQTVTVSADDGSWSRVTCNGTSGWMMSEYLRDPSAPQPFDPADPSATAPPASAYAWVNTSAGGLNMREAPSLSAELIGVIPQYTRIPVYENKDGWVHTCYGGQYGYVMASYLLSDTGNGFPGTPGPAEPTATPAPAVTPAPTAGYDPEGRQILYVTADDGAAFRAMPYTNGDLLAMLSKGDQVSLIVDQGDWSFVVRDGVMGYVQSARLSEYPPAAVTPVPQEQLTTSGLYDATLQPVWNATAIVVTDGTPLNVRSWCSTSAPIVATVPTNNRVVVLEKGETWCKISLGGCEGYCVTRYLKMD